MLAHLRKHLSAFGSIGARGAGVAAGFGVTLLVGRHWGPEANGIYALISQASIFLSTLAIGGVELSMLRFTTSIYARGNRMGTKTILLIAGLTMVLSAAVIGGVWLTSQLSSTPMFGLALPVALLPVLLIMTVAKGALRVQSAVVRSQQHFVLSQVLDTSVLPIISLALLALGLVANVFVLLNASAAITVITAVAAIFLALWIDRRTPQGAEIESLPYRKVMITAFPLWGTAIALTAGDFIGLATVAHMLSVHEAGLYRVATQFGMAFALITAGIQSIYSVKVAGAFAQDDWQGVAGQLQSAQRLGLGMVLLPAIVLMVAASYILSFIGPEFSAASDILRIMVLGQLLTAAVGPSSLVLALTGNERTNFAVVLGTVIAMLTCIPLAAATVGAIGVACVVAIAPVLQNGIAHIVLWKKRGVNGFTGRHVALAAS